MRFHEKEVDEKGEESRFSAIFRQKTE